MGEEKAKRPKWKTFLGILFIIWVIGFLVLGIYMKDIGPFIAAIVFAIGAVFLLKKYTPEEMVAREKEAEIKRHTNQVNKQKKIQDK